LRLPPETLLSARFSGRQIVPATGKLPSARLPAPLPVAAVTPRGNSGEIALLSR